MYNVHTQILKFKFIDKIIIIYSPPDIQAKIHMEIDEKVGRNRLPSLDDRKDMPYIEAFLQEVHRCSSLVPMSVFHYTLKDLNHKGYHIPKDTIGKKSITLKNTQVK